jgi:hypothetical protein
MVNVQKGMVDCIAEDAPFDELAMFDNSPAARHAKTLNSDAPWRGMRTKRNQVVL